MQALAGPSARASSSLPCPSRAQECCGRLAASTPAMPSTLRFAQPLGRQAQPRLSTLSRSRISHAARPALALTRHGVCGFRGRGGSSITCSLTSHPGEEREGSQQLPRNLSVPATGMAKFGGQLSGGGATLERSKLDLSREVKTWEPKLDDSGGGGGIGKNIFNGGGGDGDDGDDDDYFDDGEDGDGDGDDGFFRAAVGQLYDEASRNAVLAEWFRTMADMPVMLRQAASFGLLSSAQLVRFFSMDVRPNVTRYVSRSLPVPVARGIVGRLMADPAFVQKVAVEQAITIGSSLWWESRLRGERFWSELDLVAIDTACLSAANLALVWLVSPTRSYGVPHKYDWQRMLHELPSNVFDAAGPQRTYTLGTRGAAFFAKAAELCAIGTIAGGAQSLLSQAAVALRRTRDSDFSPSTPVPELGRSALGMAASLGFASNLRYQAVCGVDRWFFDHAQYLWPYLTASGILRLSSNWLGEPTRLFLQGLPSTAPERPQQPRRAAAQQGSGARKVVVRKNAAGKRTRRVKKASRGFEMTVGVPQAADAAQAAYSGAPMAAAAGAAQ